jgi:hypothetical protein
VNIATSLTPVLGFVVAVLGLLFMYPYARMLTASADRVLVAATTLTLSVGTVSLIVLFLGIVGIPITWSQTIAIAATVGILGRQYLWHPPKFPALNPRDWPFAVQVGVLILAIIGLLILFNAVYWPINIDDAVTIYAFWGKQIALTGKLPTGTLYEAYPQLVQTVYALIFQVSGQINEYAAALVPAALSVGGMLAAYLLGKELFSWSVGLIAALLMALTPAYANWASASYVDLPMGFFYAMTAVFLVRWERDQRWQDAVLTGIMAGLAMWTKNSAILLIPILGLWSLYQLWRSRHLPNLRHIALFAVALLLVGGTWYARNLIVVGVIVPPTGWTDKAVHTLSTLLPYLIDRPYFPIGVVLTIGMLFTLWRFIRSRGREYSAALLIIFYLPFFAAWWWLVSYDVRFLFGVLPIAAVMGAIAINALLTWFKHYSWITTFQDRFGGRIIIAVGLLALAAFPMFTAVDFKEVLLRRPFLSDGDKHRIVHGARYDMAQWINANVSQNSVIWSQDLLLPFLVDDRRVVGGGWPTLPEQFTGYDYWLLTPPDTLPTWFGASFTSTTPIYENDGYRLYPLIRR